MKFLPVTRLILGRTAYLYCKHLLGSCNSFRCHSLVSGKLQCTLPDVICNPLYSLYYKKSDARPEKYIQIQHNLSCVHLSVNSSDALPTCPRDLFHADTGTQRVCGTLCPVCLTTPSLRLLPTHPRTLTFSHGLRGGPTEASPWQ